MLKTNLFIFRKQTLVNMYHILYLLGWLQALSTRQEYAKADKYFQKAIELDPENADLYVN